MSPLYHTDRGSLRVVRLVVAWWFLGFSVSVVSADLTVLQAEVGSLTNVTIRRNHSGYEGSGYARYSDRGGGSIKWSYTAASSGDVKLSLRYATVNARPLDLYVDNTKRLRFKCNQTGGWSKWVVESAVLPLVRGTRVLRLQAPFLGPNVDFISISSIENDAPTFAPKGANNSSLTVVYQAEAAVSSNQIAIGTFQTGYDGRGYADYGGKGAYLRWKVSVTMTTSYEIQAKYASQNGRKCNLYIDGQLKGTLAFAGKGTWSLWDIETLTVSLNQGSHDLMILAEESTGPNIDWISVTPRCSIYSTCATAPPVSTPSPLSNTPQPVASGPQPVIFRSQVVLGSNTGMDIGQFVFSPNGEFKVGLTNQGDLVLQRRNGETIWSAGAANRGYRLFVQSDGNTILRGTDNKAVWSSKTHGHPGAELVVDDGGRIAVTVGTLAIWLDGIPRGIYTGRPNANLQFPVRGMFYYPWYPETWTVNGKQVHFVPDLGLYSNSDPSIFEAHIDALEYAWTELIICSWWGPSTNQDRGRITMMMDAIVAAGSKIKLSFYHETEREQRPSPDRIKADLDYLKKWYAWHPACAHIDDRPVIFVFNSGGCNIAERWMEASNNEWYVVLKIFPGFQYCAVQPDHWHQYGVGDGNPLNYGGYSTTIAPGFWRADLSIPLLPRVSKEKFCDNVRSMVARKEPWQLIVSFNEHGEATGVESTPGWPSDSGYGYYLDCLHQYY